MRRLLALTLLSAPLVVVAAPSAQAVTCDTTYVGASGGSWQAGPWSNGFPSSSTVACIPSGLASVHVAAGGTSPGLSFVEAKDIQAQSPVVLDPGSILGFNDPSASSFTALSVLSNNTVGGGTLRANQGAITVSGALSITGGGLELNGPLATLVAGSLSISGGGISLAGTSLTAPVIDLTNSSGLGGSGTVHGAVTVESGSRLDGVAFSPFEQGTLTMDSLTMKPGSIASPTISGSTPSTLVTKFHTTGAMKLDGALQVAFGAQEAKGDVAPNAFTGNPLTGRFAQTQGASFSPSYRTNAVDITTVIPTADVNDLGATFAYANSSATTPTITVRAADGTTAATTPGSQPQLSPTGRWLSYALTSGSTHTVDTLDLATSGADPTTVHTTATSAVRTDVDPGDGKVLHDDGCALGQRDVEAGAETATLAGTSCPQAPEVSPGGTQLAWHDSAGLTVAQRDGSSPVHVSGTQACDQDPTWLATTPARLAFVRIPSCSTATAPFSETVLTVPAAGGEATAITSTPITQHVTGWRATSDGNAVIGAATVGGRTGIWLLRADTTGVPQLIQAVSADSTSRPVGGKILGTSWPATLDVGAAATAFTATLDEPSSDDLLEVRLSGAGTPAADHIMLTADLGDGPQPVDLFADGADLVGDVSLRSLTSSQSIVTVPMTVALASGSPHGVLTATFTEVQGVIDDGVQKAHVVTTQGHVYALAATPSTVLAPLATTTVLTSPATANKGAAVLLTATTSAASGTPTGTVTFRDGATVLGTQPLDGSGIATLQTSTLGTGAHTLTADYGGASSPGDGFAPSSGSSQTTVRDVPGAPGVALTAGDGQVTVTITAPASDGGAPITGYTVQVSGPGAPAASTVAGPGPLTLAGLQDGSSYFVSVVATNAVGNGPAGSAGPVVPMQRPAPPVITGISPSPRSLLVGFKQPVVPGAVAATGWTATCTQVSGTNHGSVSGPLPAIKVTGLVDNTDYTCVIVAHSSVGDISSLPVKGRPGRLPTVKITITVDGKRVTAVRKGTTLVIKGAATVGDKPAARRQINLTFRADKTSARKAIARTTTTSKGAFTFRVRLTKAGAFQAQLPLGPALAANKEVFVRRAV